MFDIDNLKHEDSIEESVRLAFSRCPNFPKDQIGFDGLVKGLRDSAKRFKVSESAIIAECVETTQYCPTDYDLINVARSLRPADLQKGPRVCPVGKCDGSGWLATWWLITQRSADGGGVWVEKQQMSVQQYDEWRGPKPNQEVYAARHRCTCHPPRADELEKRGKYA